MTHATRRHRRRRFTARWRRRATRLAVLTVAVLIWQTTTTLVGTGAAGVLTGAWVGYTLPILTGYRIPPIGSTTTHAPHGRQHPNRSRDRWSRW